MTSEGETYPLPAADVDAAGLPRLHDAQRVVYRGDDIGVLALAQHQPVELDAIVERRLRQRQHVGGDAAEARPYRDEIIPAAGEQMQLVGHLDLPRQRGGQRDQHDCAASIVHGHNRDGGEDDGEADDAAHRAHAFARHDGADLGGQRLAQPALELGEPEPQVITVAAEDIVPGGIALRRDAIVHALVFEIGPGDRLL